MAQKEVRTNRRSGLELSRILSLGLSLLGVVAVTGYTPSSVAYFTSSIRQQQQQFQLQRQQHGQRQQQQQPQQIVSRSILNRYSTLSVTAVSASVAKRPFSSIPDPFAKLPWNVRKAKEREQKRLQLERATLHRQLGIVEDATYEEIVTATDSLIAKAGTNLKEKIRIEVAKDKILQIRLNERLAGLALNQEARAMSNYETDGAEDDDEELASKKKGKDEWTAPKWTQGLIVKPDEKHLKGQLRLWGILTAIGIALPPAQDYLGRFTWLVCVAQLTFRGMPQETREGGGMGMAFNMSSRGGHRKIAFAIGFLTWIVGAIVAYGMMPTWARGQRWTSSAAFTIQNLIFGLVSSYLQPYKG